jgi:hypothetical protein
MTQNYDTLASEESIQNVVAALPARGIEPEVVNNRAEALERVKALIPAGASVMNGSSVTLEQIGYVDYLKSGTHPWVNPKKAILAEKDPVKQALLRKQSVISDYYLGSVHAVAETGEFIVASNTGSQLPHIVFTSQNLIFVVSTKKIVPTVADAFRRLEEHVYPLEDKHMMDLYKVHSQISKIVVWKNESPFNKRTAQMIFVRENLGF